MPGQFGNSGGKKGRSGGKSKAEQLGLQALLDKCWTKEAREQCFTKLAEMCAQGNIEAMKLMLGYTYGKPMDNVKQHGSIEIRIVDESSD